MFDYKLERVEKILFRLHHKGFFHHKRIYLFGVSENTRQIIRILRSYSLEPAGILDNDKIKQGTFCSGILVEPVKKPKISKAEIKKTENKRKEQENLYIVCSLYWREMTAQLKALGVHKKNILMLYYEETLIDCIRQAIRGRMIYRHLTAQYGNIPIFLCPYTGTGDIYLIGSFWKQYLERMHIDNYVFIVISKACEKTARLFLIKNIVRLNAKVESSYIIRYAMLCPEKVNIKILNDSWPQVHTNSLEWFRGYKGLEFMQIFRKFVFELPDTTYPEHPEFLNIDKELKKFFRENHLQEKNTVILSPYSNTLADLPEKFWSEIAKELKSKGFAVCTNSCGDEEPAIEGTIPIFFSLDIAPQIVGKAGYFIGIRSGFCDVISGSDAKKVILYHIQERFFNGSTYEYFNLKGMGLCADATEIQFEKADKELLDKVIEVIG